MKNTLLFLALLLLSATTAFSQGVRVGDGFPVITTPTIGGILSAGAYAVINFCSSPANAVPCTNKATTYSDITLTTPCSTSTQITLAGTNTCVGSTDGYGNWGVWVAAGTYTFTITYSNGTSLGPYTVTLSSGGGTPGGSSGQPQYNNAGVFGGFTFGGDCTFSVPNLACTKTNGVAFSPSATTDTTNASNISSGTLSGTRMSAVNLAASGNGGVTGNLPVGNLNSGGSASNTTFWRGDGIWATPGGAFGGAAGLSYQDVAVISPPGNPASGYYRLFGSSSGVFSCLTSSGGNCNPSSGTVTSFSTTGSPCLTPLFSCSVSNPSTTPALTFTLSNFTAHTFYGNNTASTAAPSNVYIGTSDFSPNMYAAGSGTANAQTVTLSPAATAETAGLEIRWLPSNANTTGTPTVNPNGLGAITITKYPGHTALVASDLTTTAIADCIYDGTDCQLQNPQALSIGSFGAHTFLGNNTASPAAGTASNIGTSDISPFWYAAGGGSANAQTVTLAPAATALTAGVEVRWLPTAANTNTTPTLAVNGLTAKTITKLGATALAINDLTTTAIADAIYDGTEWQLQNPQTSSGSGLPASPTIDGVYNCGYTVTGGVAVAVTCPQLGMGGRALASSTSTDTIAYSDNATTIDHDVAGSAAVTQTLPTATTLVNSAFVYRYENFSVYLDTITPTTWTINGAASLKVPPNTICTIKVDPNSSTNWLDACATDTSSGGNAFAALTDGATVTWAMAGRPSANATLTFTAHSGSRTLNITNPTNGGNYVLQIIQDGTGGEGLTLGSGCTWKVGGGGSGAITPSTGAGARDILAFTYDGTNCYLNFNKNFN